jgi:hypothetical protein
MRRSTLLVLCGIVWGCLPMAFGAEGSSSPYTDAIGDIDPGIATASGTLDITGMEVSNTATDLNFKLTLNGDVVSTDWGKFMVGIATGKTDGTLTGNGWGRPINLSYDNDPFAAQIIGMNHWIGSWVDGGGGAQFWSYDNGGATWTGPTSLTSYSFTGGVTSEINMSVPLASMNLIPGDVIYFDAYSSGGGGTDSAVDSLANPNVAITDWAGPYTSYATAAAGPGLNSYTVTVPEPTVLGLGAAATLGSGFELIRRRRVRRRRG